MHFNKKHKVATFTNCGARNTGKHGTRRNWSRCRRSRGPTRATNTARRQNRISMTDCEDATQLLARLDSEIAARQTDAATETLVEARQAVTRACGDGLPAYEASKLQRRLDELAAAVRQLKQPAPKK